MLSEKCKAVATLITTAQNYNRLSKSYQDSAPESRAKLQIGTLLFALQAPLSQEQQKKYWALFESALRRYLDLKHCEVRI